MKIRFKGARPREVAPPSGGSFAVSPGQVFEVSAQVGRSLLRQTRWFESVAAVKPAAPKQKEGE